MSVQLTKDQMAQVRATAANAGLDGSGTDQLVTDVLVELESVCNITKNHVRAAVTKALARGK
jgi:hypothetical protein